ncbi:MAG: hypothetical protein PW843_08935 [Azospirillaceae bacterium]|nr:hypothetical protein [Azospirillaceae bacterium]
MTTASTQFTSEQTTDGRVFHVSPAGVPVTTWLFVGFFFLFFGGLSVFFSYGICYFVIDRWKWTYEPDNHFGLSWVITQTYESIYVRLWAVLLLIVGGLCWMSYRYLRNQCRARRPHSFTVAKTGILAAGAVYPLAEIKEVFVHAPGMAGASYSAGPTIIAGGTGELGAVVLSSSVASAAMTTTAFAAVGVARGIENAVSVSLNLRLKAQKKPVQLAFGLSEGPARDLLDEVVKATQA